MKKIIFFISLFLNLIIVVGLLFIYNKATFSEDKSLISQDSIVNYDSINKVNKIELLKISPEDYFKKVKILSKSKKCVVVFWASWCEYCPALLKVMEKIRKDKKYDFNYFLVSIDKPNEKGKLSVLHKAAKLNLQNNLYITNKNSLLDVSNSRVIYDYLPKASTFDTNPGFPHIIIFDDNRVLFEGSGYDDVYGASKFIDLLLK